ncbi:MAG: transposase [Betaproteobacteria bacterium]|nr:transposase [Betaproteobacteria bacterium]
MNSRYQGPILLPADTIPVDGAAIGRGGARRRQQYSLAEKLVIVKESLQPGVSQASISRKYRLGKNVLWTWRRSLAGFPLDALQGGHESERGDVSNLRERIAELERLLGQKAFEIELLRSRLQSQHNTMEMR